MLSFVVKVDKLAGMKVKVTVRILVSGERSQFKAEGCVTSTSEDKVGVVSK